MRRGCGNTRPTSRPTSNLGAALQSIGKTEEAVGHLRQALQSRRGRDRAKQSRRRAPVARPVRRGARSFRRALRPSPAYTRCALQPRQRALARGQSGEAVTHLRAVLEKRPDDAGAHSMGSALGMQGELAPAIAHYEQALRLKPDYADAHSNLGYALALQGKPAAAIGHYEEAVRLNPQDAEAHNALGILLAGRANWPRPPRISSARSRSSRALTRRARISSGHGASSEKAQIARG